MACEITDHSHITESYTVKFHNETYGIQDIDQKQVVSIEDMTKRVEQSLRFCVKRDGDTISICWSFMADNQPWKIESEFVDSITTSIRERMDVSIQNKDWSLMEESALHKALGLLPTDGCLMWREGESWMGVCHQFEKELGQLAEEDCELEKEEDAMDLAMDLDQFLDKASELSRYVESELAQILSRSTTAARFFQRYRNTASNYPLEERHMRGVSSMVGVYENGLTGVLIDDGNGRRIQTVLLLACLRSKDITGPFIIVTPLSLVPVWVRAFNLYSDMPVACLTGTENERKSMYSGRLNSSLNDYLPKGERSTDFPVIITSYEAAINDQIQYEAAFKYFIMDEGEGFERYRRELLSLYFLENFRANNQLFLTSGPIKSDLEELTILWRFCNPRLYDFEHLLDNYDDNEKQTIAAKLKNILKPHIVCSRENREGTSA